MTAGGSGPSGSGVSSGGTVSPRVNTVAPAIGFVLGTTSGGTGRHAAMLARACASVGWQVRLFGPAETEALLGADRKAVGFDAVTITDRPRPIGDVRAVLRLRRLCAALAADVVHAHGLRAGALAALALWPSSAWRRERARPALIVTVHNAPPSAARLAAVYAALERLVARRADVVLCVSPDLLAQMRRLGARDVQRAVVAAPGLAGPNENPADVGAGERPVVLGVGRLASQKGFDTLIAAAGCWQGRQPVPLTVIAGDGPLADDLARQARKLGVDVRFLGVRDDVPALLAAADVFVLPSRWEGQPLIVQQALRAGRPIVASNVGGVHDVTGDDAVLLVPADDPATLGRAVLRVLDDPDLARNLAAVAAARAAELPTEADAAAAVLDLYDHIRTRAS
jgi:glycosyltransferase involved in cell wall biosynthesis